MRRTIAVIAVLAFAALFGFMQPRGERVDAQILGMQKPTLVVFCRSKPVCPPCDKMKAEYKRSWTIANLIEGHALSGVEFYTWDGEAGKWDKPEGQRVFAQFLAATGQQNIPSWPTLWLTGSNTYMGGAL